jgi:hypothetical protein
MSTDIPTDTEAGFAPELVIEATGRATHPADVVLDADGHPLLDDQGEPIRKDPS